MFSQIGLVLLELCTKTKQEYFPAELNDSLYIFEFVLFVDGDVAPTRLQVVCTVLSVRDVINGKRVQLVKRRQIVVSIRTTTKKSTSVNVLLPLYSVVLRVRSISN